MIFLHGGTRQMQVSALREMALSAPTQCRALAAGYTTLVATFRDRGIDPQTTAALVDCLAMVRYMKKLPNLDPNSVVVYGCSGGGSLALEIAGEEQLAAIVCEEPATVLFTGIYNKNSPKKGVYYTATDPQAEMADPKKYYTPELEKFTKAKIAKIKCPILIARGDQHAINKINTDIVIPELKAQGKEVHEIVFAGEPHCFGFTGKERIEAASNLFPKVQEFVLPRLKTKPKSVDANLIHEVPLKSKTAMFSDPLRSSCST
jgi:dienelactone hydrolase